ncbi:metalloregulator ArsR/SmtB family transcription factor [Pseudoalteromonas tetraodonis]|uniref:metalloregulator ArsR/SmtB family transcription factor n=1 Tax=Pseudoalteromonas tetraodonis TaxID=43659 RepID=UPI003002FA51
MNPLQFYKCLADETRLKCLLLIVDQDELCVCELMEALGEHQPKVSRHLAQLRNCGLLTDRRQGQWVFYSINQALPAWVHTILSDTLQHNTNFISDNLIVLEKMGNRPERAQSCCA